MQEYFISDLRKQREQLDGLISHLKEKDQFNSHDLQVYDETTRRIEKRLRTLRNLLAREAGFFTTQNPKGEDQQ